MTVETFIFCGGDLCKIDDCTEETECCREMVETVPISCNGNGGGPTAPLFCVSAFSFNEGNGQFSITIQFAGDPYPFDWAELCASVSGCGTSGPGAATISNPGGSQSPDVGSIQTEICESRWACTQFWVGAAAGSITPDPEITFTGDTNFEDLLAAGCCQFILEFHLFIDGDSSPFCEDPGGPGGGIYVGRVKYEAVPCEMESCSYTCSDTSGNTDEWTVTAECLEGQVKIRVTYDSGPSVNTVDTVITADGTEVVNGTCAAGTGFNWDQMHFIKDNPDTIVVTVSLRNFATCDLITGTDAVFTCTKDP